MPFDVRLYHLKWPLIRRLILRRDWFTCQHCGAPDGAIGYFVGSSFFSNSDLHDYYYFLLEKGYSHGQAVAAVELIGARLHKIILTVAHLDNDIYNNSFENLLSLCGKCHLNHDRDFHITNFKYGRHWKDGQYNLFTLKLPTYD